MRCRRATSSAMLARSLKVGTTMLSSGAAAARALGAAAFPSAAPIQAAIQTLNSDSSAQVRLAAVQALNILGVDSDSAVAALQNAASNDPSPEVRQAAQTVYNRLTSNG